MFACTQGRYVKSGCNGVLDGECATCTVCGLGATVRACTGLSNAVCGTPSNCLARAGSSVYPWIGAGQRCQAGKFLRDFNSNGSKTCGACPTGWAGLNGVYCERCGALEEPYYLDRSSCVCVAPAAMNSSGGCVCPDGYRQAGGACAGCAAGTYGVQGVCLACGAGTYSGEAATACEACAFGQYRVAGGVGGCQNCTLDGWFAPDARSAACIPCNRSCAMEGWRLDTACPLDASGRFWVCKECAGGLPGNASWAGANSTECGFDCRAGFYHGDGACEACTARSACPAGRRLAGCTDWADSRCDEECVNASKPSVYSHWEESPDCRWACDTGYELLVWDYIMFQLWECAPTA